MGAIRTELIVFFILGVIGIAVGIFLFFFQFFTQGYVVNSSPSTPYAIFGGWAGFGVLSLAVGAIMVYRTYPVFIPVEKFTSNSVGECPYCGALIDVHATVCDKCKQEITDNAHR